MRIEIETDEYTLYVTETSNDILFCEDLFAQIPSRVTLWVDSKGNIDGIKVWEKFKTKRLGK